MKQYLRGTYAQLLQAALPLGLTSVLSAGAATFSVSPSVISNTYAGIVTLSVGGLTNGETVVVQKFADVNSNGAIDAADWPIQQFSLTDGYIPVIGGMTNINVPYDSTPTDGAITSQLNFLTQGIAQQVAGQYLYKLASPVGHFTPITNLFTVTNFPFAQSFTGSVRSSGTNLPNAGVLVFTPSTSGEGMGVPVAGTVADSSGGYRIKVPPGTYLLWAFQNGYVANLAASPVLSLGVGATITTNLSLVPATRIISGRLVDAANNSIGLPGAMAAWSSADGLLSVQFTDVSGSFTASATTGQWQFGGDDAPFSLLGYLQLNNWPGVDTTLGSVSNVTIAVPKGTALFYGSVKDDQGLPLPGVGLYGNNNDGNGPYAGAAITDQNGKYVMAVSAGVWSAAADNRSGGSANYIFSPPGSADVTFINGQAVQQKFTALLAANQISGWVRQTNGSPISGVGVWAQANIAGKYYWTSGRTDAAGNYALPVANGSWTVGLNCGGGSDPLQNFGDFQCPANLAVDIANNNAAANFTVWPPAPLQMTTGSLPDGTKDVFYSQQFTASGGQPPYHWYLPDGTITLPPGTMSLSDDGILSGIPTAAGTYDFWVGLWDNSSSVQVTQYLSLTIIGSSPLQVTTSWLPNATNGAFYSQQLQASGGQPPYSWRVPAYSADLPANLTLATNGVLSGSPAVTGPFAFDVEADDTAATAAYQTLSLTIANPPPPPLLITNASLPGGTVGAAYSAQLGATGGQTPYNWQLAVGSANPPSGLTLYSSGLISGTPTTNKVSTFKVQATDANFTTTNKVLSITINPKPVLSTPVWLTNRSQIRLTGATGQNYTIQYSTTLTNWSALFVTNSTVTNSFIVVDPTATNSRGFYRVLLGP